MHELQEKFLPEASRQRKIPEWGTRIFSAACVCIQPQTPAELAGGKGVRAWYGCGYGLRLGLGSG